MHNPKWQKQIRIDTELAPDEPAAKARSMPRPRSEEELYAYRFGRTPVRQGLSPISALDHSRSATR